MKKTNFARSCEINGAIATSVASCIILHGCAKLAYKSSLAYNRFSSSSPFHTVMRNCTIWFLSSFLLLPSFSSFDSTLTNSNWVQILIQTNYIASSSWSTLFSLFNSISLLCHSMHQKSPWNSSTTLQKSLISLARATMYKLGMLGIITTQKVWDSWELLFKMFYFLLVINWL